MAINSTILSAGREVAGLLTASPDVMTLTKGQPPVGVVGTEIRTPFVCYRRASLVATQVKDGRPAHAAMLEVLCVGTTYAESVELAEAVNAALDGARTERLRGCYLTDADESYNEDGYKQTLTFLIRI